MKNLLLLALIICTSSSSFFSVLIYNLTGSSLSFAIPAMNDLILGVLGLASISNLKLKYITPNYALLLTGIISLLIFDFIIFNASDFSTRVMALRKILTLLVAIIIGLNINSNGDGYLLDKYFKNHYMVFYIVAVFGFIEYSLDSDFWDNVMQLPRYWTDSGNKFTGTKGTIETAGKFYSYDLYLFIGKKTRRIVSFYTETKPLASYCMFLFPYSLLYREFRFRKLAIILLLVVGVLTYSKGFVLVVLLCIVQKYIRLKPMSLWLLLISFLCIGAFVYYKNIGYGPLSHVSGLYSGFLLFAKGNFFGVGLGATGNYTSALMESLGGGESGMGAMLGQVGIFGFLFFFLLYKLSRTLYYRFEVTGNKLYYVTYISLYGWVINFLYSESSLGFRGNIFVFLTIGMVLSIKNETIKELKNK